VFDSTLKFVRSLAEVRNMLIEQSFEYRGDLFFRTSDNKMLIKGLGGIWQRFSFGNCRVFLDNELKPYVLSESGISTFERIGIEWSVRSTGYEAPFADSVDRFAILRDTILLSFRSEDSPLRYYSDGLLVGESRIFGGELIFNTLFGNRLIMSNGAYVYLAPANSLLKEKWEPIREDTTVLVTLGCLPRYQKDSRLYFTSQSASIGNYQTYYIDSNGSAIQANDSIQKHSVRANNVYGDSDATYITYSDRSVSRLRDETVAIAEGLLAKGSSLGNISTILHKGKFVTTALYSTTKGSNQSGSASLIYIDSAGIVFPFGEFNAESPTKSSRIVQMYETQLGTEIIVTDAEIVVKSKKAQMWELLRSFLPKRISSGSVHQPLPGMFVIGGQIMFSTDNEETWKNVVVNGLKWSVESAVANENRLWLKDYFNLYYVDLPLKSDTVTATQLAYSARNFSPKLIGLIDGKITLVGVDVWEGVNVNSGVVKSLYQIFVDPITTELDSSVVQLSTPSTGLRTFNFNGEVGLYRLTDQQFSTLHSDFETAPISIASDSTSTVSDIGLSDIHTVDDSTFVVASAVNNVQYTVSLKRSQVSSVESIDQNIIHVYIDQLYPNPASIKTTLQFGRHNTADPASTQLQLVDMSGAVVKDFTKKVDFNIPAGTLQTVTLELDEVASGNYLLVMRNKGISDARILIVQK